MPKKPDVHREERELKPMSIVQKLIFPSRSLSILPVIFGSQKYSAPKIGNTTAPFST
jgi:hypothetical protein